MRATKLAIPLLGALLFGAAGSARAQAYHPAASGHAPGSRGHGPPAWRIDRRDHDRWEDRRTYDDRRIPWYVRRDRDRRRYDSALDRYRRQHRALHERIERMHAQWHRAHDRRRGDRDWYRKHAELHERLRRQHARWHAQVRRRHESWDRAGIVRIPGIYFPGHYALAADLGDRIGAELLSRLSW